MVLLMEWILKVDRSWSPENEPKVRTYVEQVLSPQEHVNLLCANLGLEACFRVKICFLPPCSAGEWGWLDCLPPWRVFWHAVAAHWRIPYTMVNMLEVPVREVVAMLSEYPARYGWLPHVTNTLLAASHQHTHSYTHTHTHTHTTSEEVGT